MSIFRILRSIMEPFSSIVWLFLLFNNYAASSGTRAFQDVTHKIHRKK